MAKMNDGIARNFYRQWKVLRNSDASLSRDFGLTVSEVQALKKHLMTNFSLYGFMESEPETIKVAENLSTPAQKEMREDATPIYPVQKVVEKIVETVRPRVEQEIIEAKETINISQPRQPEPEQTEARSEEPEGPIVFATALDRVMFKQAVNKLLHQMKEIRIKGIVELEGIAVRNRSVIRAITPLTQDMDSDVRTQALISLINLESRENAALFRNSLNDENARVRMTAIRGLYKFTGMAVGQGASYSLRGDRAEIGETYARNAAVSGDAVAISELIEHLGRERDPSVRLTLLQTLSRVCDMSTVSCFIGMLNDSELSIRLLAFLTLVEWTGNNFGYAADAPRQKREFAIQEFMIWWTRAKYTFEFKAREAKKASKREKKEEPVLSLFEPVAVPAESPAPVEEKPVQTTAPLPAHKPKGTKLDLTALRKI